MINVRIFVVGVFSIGKCSYFGLHHCKSRQRRFYIFCTITLPCIIPIVPDLS